MKKSLARGKTGKWKTKSASKKRTATSKKKNVAFISKVLEDGVRYINQEILAPFGLNQVTHFAYSSGFGVVPLYNPAGTTLAANPMTSRKGLKIYFKSVNFYISVSNRTQYGSTVRFLFFKNSNPNEDLNLPGFGNLFQQANGSNEPPNPNILAMPTQKFNTNLCKQRSDLLMDVQVKTNGAYYQSLDSLDAPTFLCDPGISSSFVRRTVPINQVITFENSFNSTQMKTPQYYFIVLYSNALNEVEPAGQSCEVGLRASCLFYES